jgi:hypothetical protein
LKKNGQALIRRITPSIGPAGCGAIDFHLKLTGGKDNVGAEYKRIVMLWVSSIFPLSCRRRFELYFAYRFFSRTQPAELLIASPERY